MARIWRYRAYGLTVELPFRSTGFREHEGRPDIEVVLGNVECLNGCAPSHCFPFIYKILPTSIVVQVPTIGRIRVQNSGAVTIDVPPCHSEAALSALFWGLAVKVVLHLRGVLPIHGSAIATPTGAAVFFGCSGAGKSTLAALLQGRGYRVLTDDLVAVAFDPDGTPFILPGCSVLRLLPDSAASTGLSSIDEPSTVAFGTQKYLFSRESSNYELSRTVLRKAYVIERSTTRRLELAPLSRSAALEIVLKHTPFRGLAQSERIMGRYLAGCAAIASGAAFARLTRSSDLADADSFCDLVQRDLP